jgi:nucleoside-diphosphate-sugar epimerase
VYGYPGVLDIREDAPLVSTRGSLDYHASKLLAEQMVAQHAERMRVTILRPTITYGLGDRDGMITRMAQLICAGRMPLIGTGKNFLHLTYIDDLLDAILAAHAHRQSAGEVYNVSGPAPIRFLELARGIAAALGTTFPRFQVPRPAAWLAGWLVENMYRTAHLKTAPPITRQMVNTVSANRSFSHQKASTRLGYAPQTSVNAGLPRALEWMERAGLLNS